MATSLPLSRASLRSSWLMRMLRMPTCTNWPTWGSVAILRTGLPLP